MKEKLKIVALTLATLALTALTAKADPTLTYYSGGVEKAKSSWASDASDTAAGWKYSVLGVRTLELTKSGPYKLSGSVTDLKVIVKAEDCTLTLDNYSCSMPIYLAVQTREPTIEVDDGATLKLFIAKGESNLSAGGNHAGINVKEGGKIIIDKVDEATDAECVLNVTGGNDGAGIGANYSSSCGDITINGGTINATGGDEAAGIGGGNVKGSSGNVVNVTIGTITINGGNVTATGNDRGAGIGTGLVQHDAKVTANGIHINGGTVTATENDGRGCGIGAGEVTGLGDSDLLGGIPGEVTINEIVITGGTVRATASNEKATGPRPQEAAGAGIGTGIAEAGGQATVTKIEISGGNVTASGAARGAGIGTGEAYDALGQSATATVGSIEISGGQVTATGGAEAAGIGTGVAHKNGTSQATVATEVSSITISGGTVTATKGTNANGENIGKATSSHTTGTTTMNSVTVIGGSFNPSTTTMTNPSNGTNINLHMLTVPGNWTSGEKVTVVGLSEYYGYGTEDLFADENGGVHVFVPDGNYVFNANGRLFEGTINGSPATAACAVDTGMTIKVGDGESVDIAYGSGTGWFYDGKKLTIFENTTATVADESRLPVELVLSNGANVTLDDVKIEGESGTPAVTTTENANVTIRLDGDNTLEGGTGAAAVQPAVGATITIDDGASEGIGKLKAKGGAHAAGIGAGQSTACGNVTIAGGYIEADGGSDAAGIGAGAGADGDCGTITITGGTVEAQRGDSSAQDVGNGASGNCAGVVVTGGSLVAEHGTVSPAPTGIGGAAVVAVTIQNDDAWTVGQSVELSGLPEGYGTKDIVATEHNSHNVVVVYLPKGGETWLESGVSMTAFTPDGDNMLLTFSAPLKASLDFATWVDLSVANGKLAVKIAVSESALAVSVGTLVVGGVAVDGARLIPVGNAPCSATAAQYVECDATAQTVTIRVPKPESGYYLYRVCVL